MDERTDGPESTTITDWEARVTTAWQRLDTLPPDAFVATIDALAAERPDDDADAIFERAAARDSTGREDEAEAFYRVALTGRALEPLRRVRATIQLASTLRILGRLDESERLLVAEMDEGAGRPLRDELRAILALTWIAQGRSTEAAALVLIALAPHLARYRRSVTGNAEEILAEARGARGD